MHFESFGKQKEKGWTGGLNEFDAFGAFDMFHSAPDPRFEPRRKELITKRDEYIKRHPEKNPEFTPGLTFDESLELAVITNPIENQIDPDKRLANDLHIVVAEKLFPGQDIGDKVRFFTSAKQSLDGHGVDAFFIIDNSVLITLDTSLKSEDQKREEGSMKADIYIPEAPLPNSEDYRFWLGLQAVGVVRAYQRKKNEELLLSPKIQQILYDDEAA